MSAWATPGIRCRLVVALGGWLACAWVASGTSAADPATEPWPTVTPRLRDHRIEWARPLVAASSIEPEALVAKTARKVVLDSLDLWRERSATPELREPALLRWSAMLAARGEPTRADSVLAVPDLAGSLWAWDALQARERLALARGDTLAADTLLGRADTETWLDTERVAWIAELARVATMRADTARALEQARLAMRRYPSLPGASAALRVADAIELARGDSSSLGDARLAAEVEALRGSFGAATRRLSARLPGALRDQRASLALRIAQFGRRARQFDTARGAAIACYRAAPDTATRALALLERARIQRDRRDSDSCLVTYARVAAFAPPGETRGVALWERAREFQDAGRFQEAAKAFDRARAAGSRPDESGYLAGLMWFAAGRTDAALRAWKGGTLEAARFWRGIALRQRHDARGDSLLLGLSELPGYHFYSCAARETLGVRSYPDSATPAFIEPESGLLGRGEMLASRGLTEDALRWCTRWLARDPRLESARGSARADDPLAAAQLAWIFGRPSFTIAYALQASREAETRSVYQQWRYVPWAYPPAFDSLVVAAADSMKLEPALLWATMRQESRFDPSARSTSNAVGLMQLLLPAAQDAARWGHEPRPTDDTPLLDPATNIQWGARYLARLVERFDGHVPVALSAYNAGASTIPPFWRDLIARGGEALFCEFASNADAQDYARRILAFRQAYRDLAPRTTRQ